MEENKSKAFDIVHPDLDKFTADSLVNYFKKNQTGFDNVPDFMIRDVFKSYMNPYENMKYKCSEFMYWWHEMLQNTNNYLLKTITQNKPGYSFIATKHIIELLKEEIENNEDLKNHCNDLQNNEDNENNENNSSKSNPDFSDVNKNIQDKIKESVKKASKEIKEKEEESDIIGDGQLAGKGVDEILLQEERIEMIQQVKINKKEIGRLINHSIKSFKKGFGSKTILSEESLFEADVIEDLINEHYLFSELLSEDVSVMDKRELMTSFDLYIDVSGSMSSNMNVYNKNVSRIEMAIALTCRMRKLKCLGNIYAFNSNIKSIDEEDIWHLSPSGGTNIEKCMIKIKKENRPSVILTDGEDDFNTYTDNAFIMAIAPIHNQNYFRKKSVLKMVKNQKFIQYNGEKLIRPSIKQ